jgi:hypothetical protein
MGVTHFEIKLLEEVIKKQKIKSVIELGSQNNYATSETSKPPFMSEWFKARGIEYACIDLAGDNYALRGDLSKEMYLTKNSLPSLHPELNDRLTFDLVTDFGTSEHVVQMNEFETIPFHDGYINSIYPKGEVKNIQEGYYNCWLNKHNLLKEGGVMINVNPMTGHWEGHGYSYLREDFYDELIKIAGYEIISQGINCATGNCETGKNVYSVLKKTSSHFPPFEEFIKLPILSK